jgi:hypothetical protein
VPAHLHGVSVNADHIVVAVAEGNRPLNALRSARYLTFTDYNQRIRCPASRNSA